MRRETDHFGVGQPWAYDFVYADGPTYKAGVKGTNQADHHVFNVKTDPSLPVTPRATARPTTRRRSTRRSRWPAPTAALVYLPAGTYNTGTTTIRMASNVVVQGASVATTKLIYGPTAPAGFYFPGGTQMAGLDDLSIQNIDLIEQLPRQSRHRQRSRHKVFLQRLNWNFGSGKGIMIGGDRIAILNSHLHNRRSIIKMATRC